MRRREIPQLVFATRSPDPKSGTDFVRQIVAASPGVSEEARMEFARRADIAGSVLHLEQKDAIRVFLFHPLADGTWLFARAVSLGLYRKGSHQLLVHGVLLSEEVMDWLEGNPLCLGSQPLCDAAGFHFLDRHPGKEARLSTLALDEHVAEFAQYHNRRRLREITPDRDPWLAAGYDALAAGERLALTAAEPRPDTLESLLLHFHPDDRLELSFQTFYSHSRRVDYRLIGVLPGDLAAARRHFRGIATVDLEAPAAGGALGELACRLRRGSPDVFVDLLERARLTYVSHRHLDPLPRGDAALVLSHGLRPGDLSGAEAERVGVLLLRSGGGLGYKLSRLAACWSRQPAAFATALEEAAGEKEKVTRPQLDRFLKDRLDHPPGVRRPTPGSGVSEEITDAQRWALAALLTRDEALAADAADQPERLAISMRLLPPDRLDELAGPLSGDRAAAAEAVLRPLAVAQVRSGERSDTPTYWSFLLSWLHHGGRQNLLSDLGVHLGQPGVAAVLFDRLADRLEKQPTETVELLRLCLERAQALDSGAAEAAGGLLAAIALSPEVATLPRILDRWVELHAAERGPGAFTGRVLAAAAARLVPVAERRIQPGHPPRILTAITALLTARNRCCAPDADEQLMRLAVRGRVLASSVTSASTASDLLATAWLSFLKVAGKGPAFLQPPTDAPEWLAQLQDELASDPPEIFYEGVRLVSFLSLAWTLWSRCSSADRYRATLAAKLRWATRLGVTEKKNRLVEVPAFLRRKPDNDHGSWNRQLVYARVPPELHGEAEKLLAPLTLAPGILAPGILKRSTRTMECRE